MKKLLLIPIILLSVGCEATVHTVYKDKYVPIPFVPKPPVIEAPEYYANTLTDEQKDKLGELAKAHVISGKEAVNYTIKLRMMYDTYDELAATSEARLKAIESLGGEVDRSLMEDATKNVKHEIQGLSLKIEEQDEELRQSLNQMSEEP